MEAEEMRQQFEKEETYEKVQDYKGAMTHRERFFAIMNFQKFDRMIDTEFGYWNNTLKRWHREGLPEKIHNNGMADAFFGFDAWSKGIPVRSSLMPTFPQEIVEQNERHTVKYDQRRIKCKVFTDGTDTIPHYIDFPIKDSESYLPFKERLLPKLQERIPQDIAKIAQKVKNRDYILQLHAGSTAGWIRDLMGFEGFSIAIYMQPELIDEILSDLSELFYSVAKAITDI
jgi:uroporphyrinogen decarboxylase